MQKICARCQFRVSGNRICQVCGFSKFIECESITSEQSLNNLRINAIEVAGNIMQWCIDSIKSIANSGGFAYSYELQAEREALTLSPSTEAATYPQTHSAATPLVRCNNVDREPRPALTRRNGELEVDYTRRQLEELNSWFCNYGRREPIL